MKREKLLEELKLSKNTLLTVVSSYERTQKNHDKRQRNFVNLIIGKLQEIDSITYELAAIDKKLIK